MEGYDNETPNSKLYLEISSIFVSLVPLVGKVISIS